MICRARRWRTRKSFSTVRRRQMATHDVGKWLVGDLPETMVVSSGRRNTCEKPEDKT